MAQSIFGGATDYSEQTCQDILSDVLPWVDLTRNVKKESTEEVDQLETDGEWELDKDIGALKVFGTLYEDAKHISEKCIAPLGRQELMWIILSFESLIPVFDKERDTYTLLKQNLKKYEQYIGELPLYQRV